MTEADLPDIATLEIGSRGEEDWIAWNRRSCIEPGFGLWAIETHTGEFVGDCGLTMQEGEGEWLVEAGWHMRSAVRSRGYATEAAVAVRGAAVTLRQAPDRDPRSDNVASQRVAMAMKVGLMPERTVHKNGSPALVFGADLHPSQVDR